MVIDNKNLIRCINLIGVFSYFFVCFFKSFWYKHSILMFTYFTFVFGVTLCWIGFAAKKQIIRLNFVDLLFALAVLFVPISFMFSHIGNKDFNLMSGQCLFMAGAFFFAIYCSNSKLGIEYSYRIIGLYLILFVACTIIFQFTPVFYTTKIVPWVAPNRADRILNGYSHGNMSGLTSHYTTNGMYMALAVIIAFVTRITLPKVDNKKNKKKFATLIFIICLYALLITGKRGPFLFAVAACVFTYYVYLSNKPRSRLSRLVVITTFVAILATVVLTVFPSKFSTITRLVDKMGDDEDMTTGRTILWERAFGLFKKQPITGIGYKQYYANFHADVHNVYLQLLTETGIIGFIIVILLFGIVLYRTYKMLVNIRKNQKLVDKKNMIDYRFLTFSFCYQIFFLMYCMTENPFYDLPCMMPYFFSVGICLYYDKWELKYGRKSKLVKVKL